jgi:hypothetical protein
MYHGANLWLEFKMQLVNQRIEGGYVFWVEDGAASDPLTWPTMTLRLPSGEVADVSELVDLLQQEQANLTDSGGIEVADHRIAQFLSHDLQALGLPLAAPAHLSIRTQGLMTSAEFSLQYSVLGDDGVPWMGLRRDGVLLSRGPRSYTLLDPIYSILEGLDSFSSLPPDHQQRFTRWSELEALLPEDVQLDGQLRSLNIASADRFSLDVQPNIEFDPVPLVAGDEFGVKTQSAVPEYFLKQFQKQFKQFGDAHRTYALGDGHYLMFTERGREALRTVRNYQQLPETDRRVFVANPQGFIKGIEADLDADEKEADLFVETERFLSSRIRELGKWSPKLGAYVSSSGIDWLPGEDIEVFISDGERSYPVSLEELPGLEEKIEAAEARGETSILVGETHIPISDELKQQVQRLGSRAREVLEAKSKLSIKNEPLVPILFDNIETLEFQADGHEGRTGDYDLPTVLRTRSLYPHQEVGIEWLVDHWRAGSPGALLADDMGLGKTLQTLAFLAWVQEVAIQKGEPGKPHLIVAPTGLLKNWKDEVGIHLTATGLGSLIEIFGEGGRYLNTMTPRNRHNTLMEADWALTTYETLRDKIEWFIDIPWSVVVFDEAQKIKNPAARVTEMSKSLEAEFTLMLTGTPVENSLADLWCIMDGVQPGLLGAQRDFISRYVTNEHNLLEEAQSLRVKLQEEINPPPMLRRMKEDHLTGLPEKSVQMLDRTMSPSQSAAYDEVVAMLRAGISGGMLGAIQRLKSISLMGKPVTYDGLDEAAIESSARLLQTLDILDGIQAKGEKALIFLESIELQKRLVPYFQARYSLKAPPMRISGEINGSLRKTYVDRFQAIQDGEFAVMLLSPKAGGLGLTLTAANHVIHLSRWWNPAVEDQCTDRIYRIGQQKPVTVWYPIATHPRLGKRSFDWNLHRLLEKKRILSRSALIGNVDKNDLEDLLSSSLGSD